MTNRTCTILFCGILAFILVSSTLVAQTSTAVGPYPFGSFTSDQDAINLGNLNVHLTIPIRHKAGRGTDFNYNLTYDSSVWYPVSVSGSLHWQPASSSSLPGWGDLGNTGQSYIGYSVSSSTGQCTPDGYNWKYWTSYNYGGFYYSDEVGARHYFMAGWQSVQVTSGSQYNCGLTNGIYPSSATQTKVTTDDSGYTLTVTPVCCGGNAVPTITNNHGTRINAPVIVNGNPGSESRVDRNGNKITLSNGTYTDTLGQPALFVTGVAPNNTNLNYTAPSGATASYVVKYGSFTVQTKFQCGTVTDYGPTTQNLVTEIDLPDYPTNPSSKYTFTYETTPSDTHTPHYVTARVVLITLPTGGSIAYDYSGGANDGISCTDGSTNYVKRTLSNGDAWTYSRSGSGANWTTTALDPSSNKTVLNFAMASFQNNGVTSDYYYETQRQVYQGASTLLQTRIRCYNGVYASCSTAAVSMPITQTDSYRQLPNGLTALSEVVYDNYGMATSDKQYDYGVSLGSPPSSSYLVRQTSTTSLAPGGDDVYTSITVKDGSGYVLSSASYYYDQTSPAVTSGTPQHQAGINYGNLTTVATQTSSGTYLYQQHAYNDTGTVANSLSANTSYSATCGSNPSICTTYSYAGNSCGNSFPTQINEPMSLSRSMAYDSSCNGGVLTSLTDENGKTATVSYTDPYFWRPASSTDPLSNTVQKSYTPNSIEAYLNFGASSTSDQLTTVDALGRPSVVQRRQAQGSSTFDSTQLTYGWTPSNGATTTQSVPYAAASGQGAPGGTAVTTTQYDALGRVTSVTDGGGGTASYTYTNQDVLQAVGPGTTFQKQFEYDGLGRLSSVCEITNAAGSGTCGQSSSKQGFWTRYQYDALGRLTGVCQKTSTAQGTNCVANPSSGQQTRTFAYDMLSRLTSETNPESGTATYTYDVACTTTPASPGDLTKKVDNSGNTTCFYYDALHRLSGGGYNGVCRRFAYDNSATPPVGVSVVNTKGRLLEAYTDNCSGSKLTDEWFGYDANGNNTDFYESTPHSGGYYHSQATYFANGSLNGLSLLNAGGGSIIPTIYYGASNGSALDGEGRVTQVTAASGTNPVNNITYATTNSGTAFTGLLTGVSFPSGDSDSFGYDPNTGRQTSYSFAVNGASDAGSIGWNANGTLGSYAITDTLSGTNDTQNCNYTYDDLGRAGSVSCGAKGSQSFTYDAFGNISKSANGLGLTFQPTNYNSANQPTGVGMSFDSAGNTRTDNLGATYTWDPNFGNPASINSTTLIYDAQGQMVEQQNGGTYTQMLYSQVGKTAIMNGQALKSTGLSDAGPVFIPLPGGATAIYNSSGTLANFRHADWLGSSRLTTTTARTVSSSSAYAPFGEQYATSGSTDASFTGQNSDTNSGLYDFTFREYSPSMGRWASPDPAGAAAANPANPQSWNRYAYVLNSPMSAIDPAGLECVWDDGSYDAADDTETGNAAGCTSAGGTYIPPETFEGAEGTQFGDWSGSANKNMVSDWLNPSAIVTAQWTSIRGLNFFQQLTGLVPQGFIYYGNWGGPGWSGSQTTPLEDLSPSDQKRLAAPIDSQDKCYMKHDFCYSRARVANNGIAVTVGSQTAQQHAAQGDYQRTCDAALMMCLRGVNSSSEANDSSVIGQTVFSLREMWP